MFFNQKPVSPPNNAYAYRSYIETLLNYRSAAKKSHFTSALWYTDTPGKMDAANDENEGLSNHRNLMDEEKNIDMIGYLHCDVFNQDKLLINGVEVRVGSYDHEIFFVLWTRQDSTPLESPKLLSL